MVVRRRNVFPAVNLFLSFPACLVAASLSCTLGCSSGPSRVEPPSISASGAASEAIELYDKDGDGAIGGAELDAVPGIKAAMATVDADKNGKASEAEIARRIEAWQATGTGIVAISVMVTMDGRPLEDAKVVFEPEPFLGDDLRVAEGQTSPMGDTIVSIPKANRPTPDAPPGAQLGFYRVRVSKQQNGAEVIPPRYNAETTLGQQIAPDDPAIVSQNLRFDLKSN